MHVCSCASAKHRCMRPAQAITLFYISGVIHLAVKSTFLCPARTSSEAISSTYGLSGCFTAVGPGTGTAAAAMQWQSQVSPPLILTVSRCLIHCSAFRTLAYIYKQLTLPVPLHPPLTPHPTIIPFSKEVSERCLQIPTLSTACDRSLCLSLSDCFPTWVQSCVLF